MTPASLPETNTTNRQGLPAVVQVSNQVAIDQRTG